MMKIETIKIKGFRSLNNVEVDFHSDLSIIVGKNNSGKSNLLSAINILLAGSVRDISKNDFYISQKQQIDQISIEAIFSGIDQYLPLCSEQHKSKIEACIQNNKIKIRRIAKLNPLTLEKIEIWEPAKSEFGTPTGIDSAFKQFLPETIYIEVFKDPSDEAQGKGTAALAKIIKAIVESVSNKISSNIKESIDLANRNLNVIQNEDGIIDQRPEELRRIETKIKCHVQKIFKGSDLKLLFNFPEINELLASATISLCDRAYGSWTPPSHKGQGFQRTLYIALFV